MPQERWRQPPQIVMLAARMVHAIAADLITISGLPVVARAGLTALAQNRQQAAVVFGYVAGLLEADPLLAALIKQDGRID
jgi:hypothetical protein